MSGTFSRAVADHERGAAAAAMQGYRMAIREGGEQVAAAYSNLGMLLGSAGRHAESVHASAAAARAAPRNPTVLYNLANARMEAGMSAEASSGFKRVVHLARQHAPAYHNLAILSHRAGDAVSASGYFRAALACGDEALSAIGGAAQVYANMAAVGLLEGSDAMEALAAHRQATARAPGDAAAHVRLAERLLDPPVTGARAAEAEAALVRALHLKPDDAHALNLLGTLLQSLPGRWAEARTAYRAAIAARPRHGDAYHNLGTVEQRLGRLDEARAMYGGALALAPRVANVYISLASLATRAESLPLLRQAIALQPTDPEGYLRLSAALAPTPLGASAPPPEADVLEAIAVLISAATFSPSDARIYEQRGKLRLSLAASWAQQAAADLADAASLQPGSAQAHSTAFLVHRLFRRPRLAADALQAAWAAVRSLNDSAAGAVKDGSEDGVLGGRDIRVNWANASVTLASRGYWVLDGALGSASSVALERDVTQRLLPLMSAGRVGPGLESTGVRTDRLWRHRRDETSVLDPQAAHIKALHALFDLVPLGLNALRPPGTAAPVPSTVAAAAEEQQQEQQQEQFQHCVGDSSTRPGSGSGCVEHGVSRAGSQLAGSTRVPAMLHGPWALTRVEDLQFACYLPGGFYKAHSDAQEVQSRRLLTAIYYLNRDWRAADGGRLRLHDRLGETIDIDPVADRVVLFDSRLEHEVLPVNRLSATQANRRGGKAKPKGREPPPRCAVTQWFQDLAPPLLESAQGRSFRGVQQ